jgi:hypothetical protein
MLPAPLRSPAQGGTVGEGRVHVAFISRSLLAALAAIGCLAVCAPFANAAFPGVNGKIAFEASDAGEIHAIDPDGTNEINQPDPNRRCGPRLVP